MTALADALSPILAAVEIGSAGRFSVAGQPFDIGTGGPGNEAAPSLAEALAGEIYQRLYRQSNPSALGRSQPAASRELISRLSLAHRGSGVSWEPGWFVRRVLEDGRVHVQKYNVVFSAVASDVRGKNGDPAEGEWCWLRVPSEMQQLLPGYFLVLGNTDLSPSEDEAWLPRLYWHLRAEAAAPWLAQLTERLNTRSIPFRLKVVSDPAYYWRADSGLLYFGRRHQDAVIEEIGPVYSRLRGLLRASVPLLTQPLAPGLAVAEGPLQGSFGQHRCGLIAEGLVRAFEAGCREERERLEAVAAAFRSAGLDPERPHLGPGSSTEYPPLELGPGEPEAKQPRRRRAPRQKQGRVDFAATASELGDGLCQTAEWYEERCNWMGHSTSYAGGEHDPGRPIFSSLGADLWQGSAGVGLFLAELYSETGEPTHRDTALGALRGALSASSRDEGRYPALSLYSGRLGVAWAAWRAAERIGSEELRVAAEESLEAPLADIGNPHRLDVITGNAGAILCLLDLHCSTRRKALLEAAVKLGEETRSAAQTANDTLFWPNERASGMAPAAPPLTGFSHGASGIALALLELFAATGRKSFLTTARRAFDYEDALFDVTIGNWPDLRHAPGTGPPVAMTAWCHGAPGIGLARARAMALDPERASRYEGPCRAALETTVRALGQTIDQPGADASLCHGQSGLVEIIRLLAAALGESAPLNQAKEAMARMVHHRAQGGEWPSGLASRRWNPSLFLGTAGVGYALLRLHKTRELSSVLLPGLGSVGTTD